MKKFVCALLVLTLAQSWALGATMSDRIQVASRSGKHTYVMFYRQNDTATQAMASTIQQQVKQTGDRATWVTVNVRDRKEAQLIKRFNAGRIPLPAVFGLAPNGAVTGVYQQKVQPAQLASAILTPKNADMVMALQQQKMAMVCLLPTPQTAVPMGVKQYMSNAAFQKQTHFVAVSATDANESDFFHRLQVPTDITSPVLVMFAPPGNHLGTFDANVTGDTLLQKVHSSGQCNCEKCQTKK